MQATRTPLALSLLGELIALPAPLARRWDQAAQRAKWTDSRGWYLALRLLESFGNFGTVADTVCHPARLVQQLELLVQEGCLRRQDASRIEDAILAVVDVHGAWR